jgi:heme o synthase
VPVTVRQVAGAYLNLMKPHVTTLLLAVTALAMVMAARGMPSPLLLVATLLGGFFAAGSANAINCYIDRDIDVLMGRTMRRAVPAGKVQPGQALTFGLLLGVASFVEMSAFVNVLAAAVALFGILFYVLIYTNWLKRSTVQNIVIGGAAGAVPPIVGWVAVSDRITLTSVLLFAIIFFWTPPHFWALSLIIKKDYERAGIPMLPVVAGDAATRRQILAYTVVLIAVTLLPVITGAFGLIYLASALVLGGCMLYLAIRLWHGGTLHWANRLFWFSNSYLTLLFAIMAIDRVIH